MNPPPLPFDSFPIAVRLVGRPALETLWSGCFYAGLGAGAFLGFVLALIFAGVLGIAVLNLQSQGRTKS